MLRLILEQQSLLRSYLKTSCFTLRYFSSAATQEMIDILKSKFPLAKNVEVVDVSGGCGAMYEVLVESQELKGLSIVKQHRMINEILKDQIKQMHGLRIHTVVPKEEGNQT